MWLLSSSNAALPSLRPRFLFLSKLFISLIFNIIFRNFLSFCMVLVQFVIVFSVYEISASIICSFQVLYSDDRLQVLIR